MKTRTLVILIFTSIFFYACFENNNNKIKIDGKYFVETDATASFKTLYYDLDEGNSIERVRNVKKVGHTKNFIVAEVNNGFYFIDRNKDNKYLNSSDIIGNLKSQVYFENWIKKNKEFDFDYYLKK